MKSIKFSIIVPAAFMISSCGNRDESPDPKLVEYRCTASECTRCEGNECSQPDLDETPVVVVIPPQEGKCSVSYTINSNRTFYRNIECFGKRACTSNGYWTEDPNDRKILGLKYKNNKCDEIIYEHIRI